MVIFSQKSKFPLFLGQLFVNNEAKIKYSNFDILSHHNANFCQKKELRFIGS
jgi:hypothetical protein